MQLQGGHCILIIERVLISITASLTKDELSLSNLVMSKQGVSIILVVKRDREKIHVYYVSHSLEGVGINNSLTDKFS